jgi:chromosome segregation ATPase
VHSFEQVEIALQKATSRAAEADEQSQRACEQIEQYEKELAEVRTELEVKKSELEAVRLRLTDAENGWTKSKAEVELYIACPDCQESQQCGRGPNHALAYGTHARDGGRDGVTANAVE